MSRFDLFDGAGVIVLGLVMIFLYLLAAVGWYWNKSKKEEQSPPAPYEQRR
jgi:hypothetical protein